MNREHTRAPSDAEIRPTLRAHLQKVHAGAVILDEIGLCRGQVRVDLAVVNSTLHGYEIKSDRDSLRRLQGQVDFYSKVFEEMTVVVGPRHMGKVRGAVPKGWGLLLVEPGPRFSKVRAARRNAALDPRFLVELLWREEALDLLASRGAARGVRSAPRWMVWDRVCERFSAEEIATAVRDALRRRAAAPGRGRR